MKNYCKHRYEKEEGIFMLCGRVTDLAEEEIYRCVKCGKSLYKKTGRKIDLTEDLI